MRSEVWRQQLPKQGNNQHPKPSPNTASHAGRLERVCDRECNTNGSRNMVTTISYTGQRRIPTDRRHSIAPINLNTDFHKRTQHHTQFSQVFKWFAPIPAVLCPHPVRM